MPLTARFSEAANRMTLRSDLSNYTTASYVCQIDPPKLATCGKPVLLLLTRSTRNVDSMKTPQQVSRKAIDEFKQIYKDQFGVELADDEVKEIATQLLRFFGILQQPLPGEDAGN